MDMCWQCQRRQSDLVNFGKHNIGEPRNKTSAVVGEAKVSTRYKFLPDFTRGGSPHTQIFGLSLAQE
jgi:hypothetical protein